VVITDASKGIGRAVAENLAAEACHLHAEEIAVMTAFLASERAAYMSGTVVDVDDGSSARP